jgi:Tfp pilus assembly protein PilO
MNKLSKDKRNKLVLVIISTLVIVVGLWYGLVRGQQERLHKVVTLQNADDAKLRQIKDTITNSKQIEAELLVVSNKLALQEEDMASGDLYSSMVSDIRKFKAPYRVDIPQFSSGGDAIPVTLLPKFPYKQATVSISGTAHFYDLGRFIADFENRFPTSRILNLELAPASAPGPEEREKLAFRLDIVSLVKPVTAAAAR